MLKDKNKSGKIAGWIAVGVSTALTTFWAFWGIVENFHEGWYNESMRLNPGLMFVQYLSPMLIFLILSLVSIFWPRLGGSLHLVVAVLASWFFQAYSNAATFLLILPLVGMGILYCFGRAQPKKLAAATLSGLPRLTLILSGESPGIRVSQRLDDGNLQARIVHGNHVDLVWAPDGPGWPHAGSNWERAQQDCAHLAEDGLTLQPDPLKI